MADKQKGYIVLRSENFEKLTDAIAEKIDEGYFPFPGIQQIEFGGINYFVKEMAQIWVFENMNGTRRLTK